jgi:hypothetical protein
MRVNDAPVVPVAAHAQRRLSIDFRKSSTTGRNR